MDIRWQRRRSAFAAGAPFSGPARWRALMLVSALLLGLPAPVRADDLAPLSDEFDDPASLVNWQDLGFVEGWVTPSFEEADIDTTEAGRFHVVPGALSWYNHLRGLLFFKEVEGDFVASIRLRVLSRHDPGDPAEPPNRSFSLAGIFAHAPRAITHAAPVPYTTDPVWPPDAFGSDYLPNTENYVFLSFGSAGNPGVREFEIKATRDSSSRLYFGSNGVPQDRNEAWLQMVRVGDTFVCLRRHGPEDPWLVENRYPNADLPLPDFDEVLQLGITAYTDWPTAAPFSNGGLASSWHFNYAPPSGGQPDLVARVDYFRIRRPDPALTEAVLQGMAVSYDPAADASADPPVPLSASPAAAPYLGDFADQPFDPYGDWRIGTFGALAHLPVSQPGEDADHDGVSNAEEFVLGGDPLDPGSAPRPEADVLPDGLVFRITPAATQGVRLAVSVSENLLSWTSVASRSAYVEDWAIHDSEGGVTVDVDPDTGEVSTTIPAAPGRHFVRLEITLPAGD